MESELDNHVGAYKASFSYELDNSLMLNRVAESIMRLANTGSTLDLGLGHGYTTLHFSKYFKKYKVLEGAQSIIDLFLEKYKNFKGEITHIFFEEYDTTEKFDNIIMTFILEHVEDPKLVLKKYRKFLKEDGALFVAVPNFAALNKRIALEAGLINNMNVLSAADLQLGHRRLFDVDSIARLLNETGFVIECIEGVFLKPLTTSQILSLNLQKEVLEAFSKIGKNYPELSVGLLIKASQG
jgi:2-polyprenyl-3-methyl-5-hydroxy-6-metoxy-1,4-benzoquinol methylase